MDHNVPNPSDCCDRCKAISGCKGFAWNSWKEGTCFYKTSGNLVSSSSGAKAGAVNGGSNGGGGGGGGNDGQWKVLKRFNLASMNAINREWDTMIWNPYRVNEEYQAYVNSPDNIFTDSGNLVLKAKRSGGKYYSGRLESKQMFSPTKVAKKKLRVEYEAKVPTVPGVWPALWMLGKWGVYGSWPQEGEIDIMEWAYQLRDTFASSLHWKGGEDWSHHFHISASTMQSQFVTYGVEYSAVSGDEYMQFYAKHDGWTEHSAKVTPSLWKSSWHPNPACNGPKDSGRLCTPMGPFDNDHKLIMNIAVGGTWGNCCGVQPHHYDVFDAGVTMTVKSAVVYELK